MIAPVTMTLRQRLAKTDHKHFVGRNLALARTSLGVSQAAFGRAIGVASNKLNQWEAGIYYPDPHVLALICEEYGFTMDWFYRGVRAGVSEKLAAGLRLAEAENTAA